MYYFGIRRGGRSYLIVSVFQQIILRCSVVSKGSIVTKTLSTLSADRGLLTAATQVDSTLASSIKVATAVSCILMLDSDILDSSTF